MLALALAIVGAVVCFFTDWSRRRRPVRLVEIALDSLTVIDVAAARLFGFSAILVGVVDDAQRFAQPPAETCTASYDCSFRMTCICTGAAIHR